MKRSRLDKFYTKPKVAQLCIDSIKARCIDIHLVDLWLEPSAGAGAFLHRLPHIRIGLDLDPNDDEIQKCDFFDWKPPTNKRIAVVGNPPFGRNSSMAIKFFNYAARWASLIGFILPRTFRKTSTQNKLSLKWILQYEQILDENSFCLIDDSGNFTDYKVPCVWQIWKPGERQKIDLPTSHFDWEWPTPDHADFAIRRVGGLAGKVIVDFRSYSTASHYYLKADRVVREKFENLYDRLQTVSKDTAGNPSLSKTELVKIYTSRS